MPHLKITFIKIRFIFIIILHKNIKKKEMDLKIENNWPFLMYSILAISLGLIGNLLGIASTFKKKLIGCGPLLMFRHLFIFDMISMFIFSNFFLEQLFGIDFKMISSVACKLYYYAGFQAASVSPLVHVYITVERFLSIKYPVESNLLRTSSVQLKFVLLFLFLNLVVYLPMYFNHDIVTIQKYTSNQTAYNKTLCLFIDSKSKSIIFVLAVTSRILLPAILMIVFSFLLVLKMITKKGRVYLLYSPREIKLFRKDLMLSFISIISNIFLICLNFPVILVVFVLKYSSISYFYAYNLYYLSYCLNFYLFLIGWSLFNRKLLNSL